MKTPTGKHLRSSNHDRRAGRLEFGIIYRVFNHIRNSWRCIDYIYWAYSEKNQRKLQITDSPDSCFMASTHLVKPRITSFTSTLPPRSLFSPPYHPLRTIATGIQQRPALLSIDRTRRFHAGARRPQLSPPTKKILMSASFFSFLGSLFSSSASAEDNMTYPDQRTDEEWRAVLSPGMLI